MPKADHIRHSWPKERRSWYKCLNCDCEKVEMVTRNRWGRVTGKLYFYRLHGSVSSAIPSCIGVSSLSSLEQDIRRYIDEEMKQLVG